MRTWTDLKGRKMEASFIRYSGDKIVIKRTDGQEFAVPPALFSSADQEYLAELKKTVDLSNKTNAEDIDENESFKGASIVVSIQGEAMVYVPPKASGGSELDGNYSSGAQAKEGDVLSVGSQIRVGGDSQIILLFSNGTIAVVGPETQLVISNFLQEGFAKSDRKVSDLDQEISASTLLLDLKVGELVVDVRKLKKKSNFEITTPLGVAGIRGTSFRLSVSEDSANLAVLSGIVGFVSEDQKENQVGADKALVLSKEQESVTQDLGESLKVSIEKSLAVAKVKSDEISLAILRDKLVKTFRTHLVPSAGNMEMIWVKPGSFMRGSQRVTLTRGFYMSKYEVTQAEWDIVLGRINKNPSFFKGKDLPVESVTLSDAFRFPRYINYKERDEKRLPKGWYYGLPTEAQWEFACRAGTTTPYSWGDAISKANANYQESGLRKTQEVGQYEPNQWGFYDMHGNVKEWTRDWYENYPNKAESDPTGPSYTKRVLELHGPGGLNKLRRVVRGGSWGVSRNYLLSARRIPVSPNYRSSDIGFRIIFQEQ